MGKIFYIWFIKLYPFGARVLSLFNDKANKWVKGRKNIFKNIELQLSTEARKRIWIHCSSLGEFEQGLPVIEELKKQYAQHAIILTFFSPSGYENQKNNKIVDHVFYMPLDNSSTVKKFYDIVNPDLVLFVKYEFWYYYLNEARKRNIPLLLVSGIFRSSQPFFKWYGSFYKKMLTCFTQIFVQDKNSMQLLQSIHFKNVTVGGDTRFDRVIEIADNFRSIPLIKSFCKDKKVVVAGSTWIEDDEALDHYANSHRDYRFIIAPHDIGEERLKECDSLYKKSVRFSNYDGNKFLSDSINTLIIDNIGTLKYLYKYATICYVGGGFGSDGVHNVLEAAVYNKPVVFGPEYEKFIEAAELIDAGGGFEVENALELEDLLDELFADNSLYIEAAKKAGEYVTSKAGATHAIMRYIQEKRLLTN